jgi:hypothetical protein
MEAKFPPRRQLLFTETHGILSQKVELSNPRSYIGRSRQLFAEGSQNFGSRMAANLPKLFIDFESSVGLDVSLKTAGHIHSGTRQCAYLKKIGLKPPAISVLVAKSTINFITPHNFAIDSDG